MALKLHTNSRIVILGTSGSGKTTLAKNLCEKLNLKDIELDALFWEPNWTQASQEVFRARILEAIKAPGWAVHGNYSKVQDLTIGNACTVIWLDYPKPLVMWRVLKRTVGRLLTGTELWAGNRESFRLSFLSRESILLWAWQTHAKNRARYEALWNSAEVSHLQLIRLKRPREANRLLSQI